MRRVYLDYAATTPVAPEVLKAMQSFWSKEFGNPMAVHSFGAEARKAIEEARETIAGFFNVDQEEIIFTSGATESNNLALRGTVKGVKNYVERYGDRIKVQRGKDTKEEKQSSSCLSSSGLTRGSNNPKAQGDSPIKSENDNMGGYNKKTTHYNGFIPHIITTPFEHHCLLDSAKDLLKGDAQVTFVKVGRDGVVDPKSILEAIKPNTVLVSVMYVNNEIGTVAPLKEIGDIIQKERIRRKEKAGLAGKEGLPIYFHSDITQAVNYLPCNMKKLGVDLFSLSAHKIYGPKGVGALGVKKGVLIEKIQLGGEQEFDLRAGTHNVTGIVGMSAAIGRISNFQSPISLPSRQAGNQISNHKSQKTREIQELRDYFWKKLQREVKDIKLNGSLEKRVANNLNVSFAGVEGESMILALDMAGVACSTGSACSSENLEPSHVLLSIGRTHPEAHGSLRFTIGEGTTKEEIDYATLKVKEVVGKLRLVSGYRG